jgi:DNA polymerase III delta prime subunit
MDVDDEGYPDPDEVNGLSDADEAMAAEFEEEFGLPDELDARPIRPSAKVTAAAVHEPTAEPDMEVEIKDSGVAASSRAPHASSVHTETFRETDWRADMEAGRRDEGDAEQVQMHFIVPGHHGESDTAGCDVEVCQMARKARTPLRIDASGQMLLPIAEMIENIEREKLAATSRPKVAPDTVPAASDLWVDRYCPRSFMELLSDERLNRQVLHWVKEWEGHVFGKNKRTNRGPDEAFGGAARNANRPEKPLLLLSGPPGLGKTTLVKIVAKHAGYRLMEINASDDRSAKLLKQRIKDATEVQPVFGTRKPVLVVLDEIDGAMGGSDGSGAISELLRLASATGAAGGGVEHGSKKGWDGLHRPVICICNDLYAPALRPLRDVAEVLQFKPGRGASLVFRLKAVCSKEGLQADDHTLNKLAQMADGDVRACLNTLQFARMRSKELTYETLLTMPIGNKDHAKGALDLWKQVFILPSASSAPCTQTRPQPNRSRPASGAKGAELHNSRQAALFDALHRADVERVIDGAARSPAFV